MKLNKMTMENFRQFYGTHDIVFSSGDKNITIIYGENGKGKTGIYRALMFSLFGNVTLEQDNKDDDVHIVNFVALTENKPQPVEASVTIEFEAKSKRYKLKRKIKGVMYNGSSREQLGNAELTVIDEHGNYSPDSITDEHKIKSIVHSIIDESIKDFFFFDGEKIAALSKTSTEMKKEVKNGIIKLLHIDKLQEAINVLTNLRNDERRRIAKEAKNLNIEKKQQEINDISCSIEQLEELMSAKEMNMEACSEEIGNIRSKLDEDEDIKKIQEQYDQINSQKAMILELLKEKKEQLRETLTSNGMHLQLKDIYPSVKNYLKQVLTDQEDLVPIEIIEKSLEEMTCATCGSDLTHNDEMLNNIKRIKQNYKRSDLTAFSSMISGTVTDFQQIEEEVEHNLQMKLSDYRTTKDDLEEIERDLDTMTNSISNKANQRKNLKVMRETLEMKEKEYEELRKGLLDDNDAIASKIKELKIKEKEFNTLISQSNSLRTDKKVLDRIDELRENFINIFEDYSFNMRQRLTDETTAIFKTLIDRKDKELINKININEKYEIEIIGWDNMNFTSDISQGQRQIVSLAFITALAKVATGGQNDIHFPLFMDTPFGRISGNNRDHLIENIPELTSQWILLLTDTELTKEEERKVKGTNKLGGWYLLHQNDTMKSSVIEIDIKDSMATRG